MFSTACPTAFLFDLDGTLLDSSNLIAETANLVRRNWGFLPLSASELFSYIGLPAHALFQGLGLPDTVLRNMVKEFRQNFQNANPSETKIYPGAIDFIVKAKRLGFKIATATTRPTEMAQFQLGGLNIANYFDLIQGTDDFLPKPSPDVILKVRDSLGISNIFMFGDRVEDMQAAKAAEVIGIGIAQSSHGQTDLILSGAHEVYQNFAELPEPENLVTKYS